MKVNAYCVYDRKSMVYNTPYFLSNDNVALRHFDTVMQSPDSLVGRYPEDYQMFRIASMETSTGVVTPEEFPVYIISGTAMIKMRDIALSQGIDAVHEALAKEV